MPATQALCANACPLSLHAGVRFESEQRSDLEQLRRYVTRLAIANERQLWRNSAVSCGSITEVAVFAKQSLRLVGPGFLVALDRTSAMRSKAAPQVTNAQRQ